MKKLTGFKQILNETTDMMIETEPRFTRPEATAMSVKHAIRQVWSLMGDGKIGGLHKTTEEVFGVSYKDFLEECNR